MKATKICFLYFSISLTTLVGCRTAEKTTILVSRVKSPISFSTKPVNRALDSPVTEQTPSTGIPEKADTLDELKDQPVVAIVTISGGGARATRLAAHTMAELEKKWEESTLSQKGFLRDQIDIWSTVSGGSIFASWVSETQRRNEGSHAFRSLVGESWLERMRTQQLGGMSAAVYLSPGNLGYAPLMLFFSEWDTLNLFARTHAMSQRSLHHVLVSPEKLPTVGNIPSSSRYFFNATLSQNGRPMVFTGGLLHGFQPKLQSPPGILNPLERWLKDGDLADNFSNIPLPYATTLEDIGSSPKRFPIAYAAMASAAFPIAFDPLPLTYYGSANAPSPHTHRISVMDGGIYDNTGAVTALELIEFIARRSSGPKRPRFLLLMIDANLDVSDALSTPAKAEQRAPIKLDFPFRGFVPASQTISTLYMGQKNLTKAVIRRRISQLDKKEINAKQLDLRVIELDLAELYQDMFTKNGKRPENIPTDFVINKQEDEKLKELALFWSEKKHNEDDNGRTNAEAFLGFLRPQYDNKENP